MIEQLERLGGFANYSAEELAQLCFVSVRTARRWRRIGHAPPIIAQWLRLLKDGDLETIHAAWKGWTLRRDGQLHHPNGWMFSPNELTAVPLRYQETSSLRVEVRKLTEQLKQQQAAMMQPVTVTMTMQLPAARLHELTAFRETVALFDSTGACATA